MPKVSVLREVTELTGTELLDAYDSTVDKVDIRAELLRRLDPPPPKRQASPMLGQMMKGKK